MATEPESPRGKRNLKQVKLEKVQVKIGNDMESLPNNERVYPGRYSFLMMLKKDGGDGEPVVSNFKLDLTKLTIKSWEVSFLNVPSNNEVIEGQSVRLHWKQSGRPLPNSLQLRYSVEGDDVANSKLITALPANKNEHNWVVTVEGGVSIERFDECYVWIIGLDNQGNLVDYDSNPLAFKIKKRADSPTPVVVEEVEEEDVEDQDTPVPLDDDEGLPVDIPKIEKLLKENMRLPQRNLFAFRKNRTLLVSQFAIDLIFAERSILRRQVKVKLPVIFNRLEELGRELENENYASKNGANYNDFKETLDQIRKRKRHFIKLNDEEEIKKIRGMAAYGFEKLKENEEFAKLFNENFKPKLEFHNWERIYSDKEKFAFLCRAKDVHNVTAIRHMYEYFDRYYSILLELDSNLNKMKRIISKIKKDLGL